eukprot:m51a1_g8230 hypothetical protein (1319) ;mRNA; f:40945-49548
MSTAGRGRWQGSAVAVAVVALALCSCGAVQVADDFSKYCDVVTFNFYPTIDPLFGVPDTVINQLTTWYNSSGSKPLMITEWSFPALDAGLPSAHGAGMRVTNQTLKSRCFMFLRSVFMGLPFIVGDSYFMFIDEPALGISSTFPEDSNYGLVDVNDNEWSELVASCSKLNPQACRRHAHGPLDRWINPVHSAVLDEDRPEIAVANESAPLAAASRGLSAMFSGPKGEIAVSLAYKGVALGNLTAALWLKDGASTQGFVPTKARVVGVRRASTGACDIDVGLQYRAEGIEVVVTDDFGSYPNNSIGGPNWLPPTMGWRVINSQYVYDNPSGDRALARHIKAHVALDCSTSARVRVLRRAPSAAGTAWGVAGIAIMADSKNYWALQLVEKPITHEHFVELGEYANAVWLAQGKHGKMVESWIQPGWKWEFGVYYTMAMQLLPQTGSVLVRARISNATSTNVKITFNITNLSSNAVVMGRTALSIGALHASWDSVWEEFLFLMFGQSIDSKDDPWIIGHFVDNELEWWGRVEQHCYKTWCMFNQVWSLPAEHSAKLRWVSFLQQQFPGSLLDAMKTHWNVTIRSVAELLAHNTQFVRLVAENYFGPISRALKAADPNHMYFCTRWPGRAPDVMDIAGKYCDVVTFNFYPTIDPLFGVPDTVINQLTTWYNSSGSKPLMITEWSFPALDAGLPSAHGAGMRVTNQTLKSRCFMFLRSVFMGLPFIVGDSYFMFIDEPALGISSTFPEDSNYGLVDVNDNEWSELVASCSKLNPQACRRHAHGPLDRWINPVHSAVLDEDRPEIAVANESAPLAAASRGLSAMFSGPKGEIAVSLAYKGVALGNLTAALWLKDGASTQGFVPTKARVVGVRRASTGACDIDVGLQYRAEGIEVVVRATLPPDGTGKQAWVALRVLSMQNSRNDNRSVSLTTARFGFVSKVGGSPASNVRVPPAPYTSFWQVGSGSLDVSTNTGVGMWYIGTHIVVGPDGVNTYALETAISSPVVGRGQQWVRMRRTMCADGRWKTAAGAVLVALICAAVVLSFVPSSPVQLWLYAMFSYVTDAPWYTGSTLFVLCYVLTVLLMLPATPLNLAAGFIYEIWLGSAVSVVGISLGALAAFVLGRTLMREWAARRMRESPMLRALDRAVSSQGFLIVFLLRLAPVVPFAICCYALGATNVPFGVYAVASVLGLFIPTVAYCYLGTLMKDLKDIWADDTSGSKLNKILGLAAIATVTVVAIAIIAYVTKRALDRAMAEEQTGDVELGRRADDKEKDEDGDPVVRMSPSVLPAHVETRAVVEMPLLMHSRDSPTVRQGSMRSSTAPAT